MMKPWTLPLFVISAMLAPVGLIIRFGLLTPLGLLVPPLRRIVRERFSALSINPAYRRAAPEGDFRRQWRWQEGGACLWVWALLSSVALVGAGPLLTYLTIHAGLTLINQVRTLVAHLWENDGAPMSVTAQYLDSVNVPPPGWLAAIWAPVGLRYHALHHLLPSLPDHALAEAHRRITVEQAEGWAYPKANYRGMAPLMWKLMRCMARRTARDRSPQQPSIGAAIDGH